MLALSLSQEPGGERGFEGDPAVAAAATVGAAAKGNEGAKQLANGE